MAFYMGEMALEDPGDSRAAYRHALRTNLTEEGAWLATVYR